MAAGAEVTNLNLTPGHCLKVKGFIPADCKRFSINMGEDSSNFVLHFNPRFDYQGDVRKIVCNSKDAGKYGSEQRQNFFPFQAGTETTICFEYQTDKIIIKLASGQQFSFPVRKALSSIQFLTMDNIELKSITSE